jgi:transaldolase
MARHLWLLSCIASASHLLLALSAGVEAYSTEFRGGGRLFLDTADVAEWDDLLPLGIFHGVTTNPILLQRAGQPCVIPNLHAMASKALQYTEEFMCQAWGRSVEELVQCGLQLAEPSKKRIVVKVPVTVEGVQAARILIDEGVRVCLTACYDHKQAMIATSVGAEYIAPYLGRMTEAGKDGKAECFKMQEIVIGMQGDTRILVASIRDVQTMVDLAAKGMETFTFSPEVARELFAEPLTVKAAKDFEEAAIRNSMMY